MAGSNSDYKELAVLNHFLKGTVYTQPAHIYLGLFTVVCTDAALGTEVPNTNAYVRQIVDAWTFSASSPTQGANTSLITFPAATPAGWATILGWALADVLASGTGNLLDWGDGLSQLIGINGVAEFLAGAIVITQD
jgi:hypothetical protein